MALLLMIVGFGWAGLGVLNVVMGVSNLQQQGYGETWTAFALLFNMVLFIIPGLVLGGIGGMQKRRSAERATRDSVESGANVLRKCPFCAEMIRPEAIVCRFCGRDLPIQHDQDCSCSECLQKARESGAV